MEDCSEFSPLRQLENFAAGCLKVCMVESVVYDKSTKKTCRASREVFQQQAASVQRTVGQGGTTSSLAAALLAAALLKHFQRIKKSFYPASAGRRIV